MKKLISLVLALMMLLSLTACGSSPSSGSDSADSESPAFEEMNLKLSIVVAETTTWYTAAVKFAEDVSAATGGAVKIDIYPNEQLSGGNQAKGVEMLMSGSIDMDMRSGMWFNALDERFAVMNLPFLYDSAEKAEAVASGKGGEKIGEMLEEYGVHLLGMGENGWRQLTNNVREITKPEDLKNLKIRTPGVPVYLDTFTALGANPVSMNWAETFTALQQGTVDGQENPNDISKSSAIQEVQKYLTIWDYSYDPFFFNINGKLWDSFSPELQEIFETCAKDALSYQWTLVEEADADAAKDFEAAGAKVTTLTEDQRQAFKDATADVVKTYQDKWGEDFMSNFIPQ